MNGLSFCINRTLDSSVQGALKSAIHPSSLEGDGTTHLSLHASALLLTRLLRSTRLSWGHASQTAWPSGSGSQDQPGNQQNAAGAHHREDPIGVGSPGHPVSLPQRSAGLPLHLRHVRCRHSSDALEVTLEEWITGEPEPLGDTTGGVAQIGGRLRLQSASHLITRRTSRSGHRSTNAIQP